MCDDMLDIGLYQLRCKADDGDLPSAAVLDHIARLESVAGVREDEAHGLDTESSVLVDALQTTYTQTTLNVGPLWIESGGGKGAVTVYTQTGTNEVLR